MECKLCGCEKKLVEAHVIPRSFHEPMKQGGQTPIIITSKPGVYPKQSHTGVYDKEIVCEACEAIFSSWDDYGHEFLTQKLEDARYICSNGKRLAYNFGPCNYENLKLFFLSVLWRAGVSKQQLFNKVQLGSYEEKLRQVILSKEAGGVADFSIALSKFDAPANETGILNPDRTEYDGVNHYRLYLGGYMAIIKVSNQPPPKCFDGLYLAPNRDVYCLLRNFRESKEFAAMIYTVKNSRHPTKN